MTTKPPQGSDDAEAIRVEKALLGALLMTNHVGQANGLTPSHFKSPKRAAIFAAMLAAKADNQSFDGISLAADLALSSEPPPKAGWLPTLAGYLDDTCADMIPEYTARVKKFSSQRTAIALLGQVRGTGNGR